jgi:hypothetical protein
MQSAANPAKQKLGQLPIVVISDSNGIRTAEKNQFQRRNMDGYMRRLVIAFSISLWLAILGNAAWSAESHFTSPSLPGSLSHP